MKCHMLRFIKNWKAGWAVYLITHERGTRSAKLVYLSKGYTS